MRSVTYTMGVSLDGYIVGPGGGFDWTGPDEEVFRSALDEVRQLSACLLSRRLYETMLYWQTADDASLDDVEREFAAVWNSLPKVVLSTTLSAVQGNARLATGSLAQEVERLRTQQGEGDIAVGGATLAAEAGQSCRSPVQYGSAEPRRDPPTVNHASSWSDGLTADPTSPPWQPMRRFALPRRTQDAVNTNRPEPRRSRIRCVVVAVA